jgi:hypothetical protein
MCGNLKTGLFIHIYVYYNKAYGTNWIALYQSSSVPLAYGSMGSRKLVKPGTGVYCNMQAYLLLLFLVG